MKDLQTQSQTETITGLLLMYPKYCVHVIEVNALFNCFVFCYISVNFIRQTDYVTSTITLFVAL